MTPLRVAVIGHTAAMSGAEVALARMLRCVDRRTVHVTVILFAPGELVEQLRRDGFDVRVLELDPGIVQADRTQLQLGRLSSLRAAARLMPFTLRLARLLRELDIDVVHCNSLKADLIGGLAGRLVGCGVVWYVHDRISEDYLPRPIVRVLRFGARIVPHEVIANSEATLATLRPRRAASRYSVAHPGLDAADFASTLPDPPATPTLGIVGRVSPTKGQDVFLRAAKLVAAQRPETTFVVIGAALFNEAEFQTGLHALAAELGIADQVQFTGHVADVRVQMAALTAVVHASPVPEPFGQVIVEAMALGVPVIATAAGGVPEITGPSGRLALLVPPGDSGAMAAAMQRVLDNSPDAQERSARAQQSVRERFTAAAAQQQVSTVWARARLHRRGRRTRGRAGG